MPLPRAALLEGMAVESALSPIPSDQPHSGSLADLRNVPLDEMPQNVDALQLVIKALGSMEGSARATVTTFNSAI